MIMETLTKSTYTSEMLDQQYISKIRFLSTDAIQKVNSEYTGLSLWVAPLAFKLWTKHLQHNSENPDWFSRDRFVLSASNGSMLFYSLFHLTGYTISPDEIKKFRQRGRKAPRDSDRGVTPGIETATGQLGWSFANDVGMAIALLK